MAPPLAKRLQVKPGQKSLAVKAPTEYAERLGELPHGGAVACALWLEAVAGAGRRGERRRP